jgi:hypothetical protein
MVHGTPDPLAEVKIVNFRHHSFVNIGLLKFESESNNFRNHLHGRSGRRRGERHHDEPVSAAALGPARGRHLPTIFAKSAKSSLQDQIRACRRTR